MKILSVGIVLGALITLILAASLEADPETKYNYNAEVTLSSKLLLKLMQCQLLYYTMIQL